MSYDPLTHSIHNAGERSAKVGHEINVPKTISMSLTSSDSKARALHVVSRNITNITVPFKYIEDNKDNADDCNL